MIISSFPLEPVSVLGLAQRTRMFPGWGSQCTNPRWKIISLNSCPNFSITWVGGAGCVVSHPYGVDMVTTHLLAINTVLLKVALVCDLCTLTELHSEQSWCGESPVHLRGLRREGERGGGGGGGEGRWE